MTQNKIPVKSEKRMKKFDLNMAASVKKPPRNIIKMRSKISKIKSKEPRRKKRILKPKGKR